LRRQDFWLRAAKIGRSSRAPHRAGVVVGGLPA
jgi:hypothetical protein